MLVRVGSENRAKVEAVRTVFSRLWPDVVVEGRAVALPASIPEMPTGEAVREGARARARAALADGAAFGVGAEGGVEFAGGEAYLYNWVAILRSDGVLSEAPSAKLRLPPWIGEAIRRGEVLGELMAKKLGRPDINEKEGAVGHYTGGLVDRKAFFEECLAMAIAPFLHPEEYGLPRL